MQKKSLTIYYEAFGSIDALPENDRLLLLEAKAALNSAYAPYSAFQVGAAVRLENGTVMRGANQENAAYPMCLCAERVALAAAHATYPRSRVLGIAITARYAPKPVAAPATPCGACRQVIAETEDRFGQPMTVLLQGETGLILKFASGRDLLPLGFAGSALL